MKTPRHSWKIRGSASVIALGFAICVVGFSLSMLGSLRRPDVPALQAEGEILVKAVYKYKEMHGHFPADEKALLTDENIPVEAKSLLGTAFSKKWEYDHVLRNDSVDEFLLAKYTGFLASRLVYRREEDENGNGQYHWRLLSGH